MSKAGAFETIVGALVILVACSFLLYAYSASGKDLARGAYGLEAVFGRIDGVAVGSEVRIAGVKVGSVTAHVLDTASYEARVMMRVAHGVPVPDDSIAKVVSDGLLGGAYISIEPGASEMMLADGGTITQTQGSVDLLGLAVQAFSSNAGKGGEAPSAENSQ